MDPFVDDGSAPDHFQPDGFYHEGGNCNDCYEPSGGYPCDGSCDSGCCGPAMYGCGGSCGQWFVTADYLNVRAHFSDAPSFVERESNLGTDPAVITQRFHQLDFDFESSYRLGGGYRLCNCGDEIRFMFTRLRSTADDSVVAPGQNTSIDILLPYTPEVLEPGDEAFIRASVDVNTYDLEYRKTIPLGGPCSSGCADPCGCGDACGCACPAWDITWSGGIRGANVDWRRSYVVIGQVDTDDSDTTSSLEFDGVGPRAGLEGRRYFGCNGWFSIFLKGDLSLLLGHVEVNTVQNRIPLVDETHLVESLRVQEIIPVTEFEAGMAANITCHSTISAGYMASAWHDLGFREEAVLPPLQLNTHYDDANTLSFDGFFARLEWSY